MLQLTKEINWYHRISDGMYKVSHKPMSL